MTTKRIACLPVFLAALLSPCTAMAQKPTMPTLLSVGDVLGNYGIERAWADDTAAAATYLDSQPQDYVALTNMCVNLRARTTTALRSLENDYPFRDSLIWVDSVTALTDYALYAERLNALADFMGRRSIRYSRMEQQRIAEQREAARLKAEEEARRAQEERNRRAGDLRDAIGLHHRAITEACDGPGITDKARLKELKDLYYSYLMVYNKYDLAAATAATDETVTRLDELSAFQLDLLDNVLGSNSLPHQIENFKNILKVRCGKENADVYRSYSRVFKHTTVPVAFADLREYEDYIARLRTIVAVQQRYLQTLDLRATIAAGTEAVVSTFGRKYRDEAASYRDALRAVDQLPAFTSSAESQLFIQHLDDFVEAQQLYLDLYPMLESCSARSDSILSRRDYPDVVSAYRTAQPQLHPLPSFRDREGAARFMEHLDEVATVQQLYLDALEMRTAIAVADDSLTARRRIDRTLTDGYRLLRKQTDLRPHFATVERGRAHLDMLRDHHEMQRLCMTTLRTMETVQQGEHTLTERAKPYRGVRQAYKRMSTAYRGLDEITNTEDLRRYSRQCERLLHMQEAFLNLLSTPTVADADARLRKETNIENIKLILGL